MASGLPATFKLVCRDTRGVINHVKEAPREKDTDDRAVKEAKRLDHAQHLKERWLSSYLFNATVDIVKCG